MNSSELLSAPLTVNWSLSYRCNFNCDHCYSRTLDADPLPVEKVKKIIDILAQKGVVLLNFGGGEPLLVPNLMEIAAYAVSMGLKVSMNSNGWLVDRQRADLISKAGFFSVGISIDSPDPLCHDRFRNREGSFVRAVRALDNLGEAGIRTTVSCVITRINLGSWQGMIELCQSRGVFALYMHNFKCPGPDLVKREDLDLSPDQWRDFYIEAMQVRDSVKGLAISFDDPVMAALPGYEHERAVPGSTCGKLSLHIGPDGRVTPCGFIPVSIGNILEDNFDDIWLGSPVLKMMRSKTPRGKCNGCTSYDQCLGGCTARVYAVTGTFDQPDPHCWIYGEGPDD